MILEDLVKAIRRDKEIKGIQVGREEIKLIKLSLFANDMIFYIENLKNSKRKHLGLINEFNEIAGYKINLQISVVLSYINNEISEKEIKKIIPFIIASKIIN